MNLDFFGGASVLVFPFPSSSAHVIEEQLLFFFPFFSRVWWMIRKVFSASNGARTQKRYFVGEKSLHIWGTCCWGEFSFFLGKKEKAWHGWAIRYWETQAEEKKRSFPFYGGTFCFRTRIRQKKGKPVGDFFSFPALSICSFLPSLSLNCALGSKANASFLRGLFRRDGRVDWPAKKKERAWEILNGIRQQKGEKSRRMPPPFSSLYSMNWSHFLWMFLARREKVEQDLRN